MQSEKKRKLNYKWVTICLCFAMVFTAVGFFSSTKGLFVVPITNALGISRSAYSINDTLRYIATAVVNMFFGSMIHRYGAKRLISAGFILLILSALTYAFANHIMVFYIGGIFFGVGFSWTGTAMASYIVARWCKRNRGTITGAVLASNGIGSAIASQILTPIIYDKSTDFGYRNAYFVIAAILLIVGILIVVFLREEPRYDEIEDDDYKDKDKKSKKKIEVWDGMEFSETVKKPYFYAAAVCIFLTGMVLQSITSVAPAYLTDVGLDSAYIATVVSVQSLALTGAKFLAGFLYDKLGLRAAVTICSCCSVVALLSLIVITPSPTGNTLAIVYSILAAVALPLETVMVPLIALYLFGDRSYNQTMGIFLSINTAGYALGTPLINLYYDGFGSYAGAFIICAVIMVAIIIAMQFCINAAHKQRKLTTTNA